MYTHDVAQIQHLVENFVDCFTNIQELNCRKDNFFVSELDLYIYILEVSAKDEFISPDGYTTLQDLISFNLMQDMSYVNMIQEFIGTVMEYPDEQSAWANNIQSYKAVLEQIR